MANTNKDIDKILQDIKKRKEGSGVFVPTTERADILPSKREPVLIKSTKTIDLKKPAVDNALIEQQRLALEQRTIAKQRAIAEEREAVDSKQLVRERLEAQAKLLAQQETPAKMQPASRQAVEQSSPLASTALKSRSMSDVQRLISEIKNEKNSGFAPQQSAPVQQISASVGGAFTVDPSAFSKNNSSDIHEENFLAKLATALNDNPEEKPLQPLKAPPTAAKSNLQVPLSVPSHNVFEQSYKTLSENEDGEVSIDKKSDKTAIDKSFEELRQEQSSAENLIDDKFVDFFTQSIIVPHEQDTGIHLKSKKRGFFKKKYITDSLSLTIPEEDIKKAESNSFFKKLSGSKYSGSTDKNGENADYVQKSELPLNTSLNPTSDVTSADSDIASDITAMFKKQNVQNTDEVQAAPSTKYHRDSHLEKTPKPKPVFEKYTLDDETTPIPEKQDPAEILKELNSFKTTLTVRFSLSLICAIILLYLNFGANMGFPLPSFISPTAQPLIFYVVTLLYYAIALLGFLPTIANGFVGIFKSSTSDSFLSLASIMCLLQLILAVANAENIETKTSTIFAGFVVLALSFNALGKLICANTISRNLSLADVPDGINAGYIVKDPEAVKKLSRTLEEKSPQILVSRKTGSITNFISGGFSSHSSEKNAKQIAIFTYVVTLVCFFIGYFASRDITVSVFTATGASVLMLPLSHTLISSVPSSLMQKSLKQVGALVNGWQGIDSLSGTTHVSFDAKHLFPKGSVVLHGIKTFEKERLDLAILYASSIAIEKCDNLRPVFLNVIENKTDMLFPLESCEYKVGQGYIAWIEHNRVIMGNRNIMSQFDVELPPISLETKFTSEGKKPIYLSVNGKLFGMFVVSYHADKSVKENLDRLIQNDVNVILQSNDFNIDSQLLELVYRLPLDSVQVLNQNETALLLNYTQYSETTESCVAHLDSLYSLAAGFCGADSAKSAASTCSIVQTVSVIIGAVLAVIFSYSQTLPAIPLLSVILLGFGWMGLCLMRALAKKYY